MVNLFIVGVMKSATTFIHETLISNPCIEGGEIKEPNFFSSAYIDYTLFDNKYKEHVHGVGSGNTHIGYISSIDEYKSNYVGCGRGKYILDSSVSYAYFDVANLIYDYNPKSKIIFCLREPVSRAYSHYKMDYAIGRHSVCFEDAFNNDMNDTTSIWGQKSFYYELGLYAESVKSYIDTFGRENILILFQDELNDSEFLASKLTEFLGVNVGVSLGMANRTNRPKFPWLNRFMQESGFKSVIKRCVPQQVVELGKAVYYGEYKDDEDLSCFKKYYIEDVKKLSAILGEDLVSKWGYEK